jgi:hypothetical protein
MGELEINRVRRSIVYAMRNEVKNEGEVLYMIEEISTHFREKEYFDYADQLKEHLVEFVEEREENAHEYCEQTGIDPYENEIYEHWAITDNLAYFLRDNGETVVDLLGLTIWGRCTTGQAISMDYVIKQCAIHWGLLPSEEKEVA